MASLRFSMSHAGKRQTVSRACLVFLCWHLVNSENEYMPNQVFN